MQIAALVLLTVFSLGPLVAFWVVLGTDSDPTATLLAEPEIPTGGVEVATTVLGVNAAAGELRARLVLRPAADLLQDGRLTVPLTLQVNDARGQSTWDYAEGQPPGPVEVVLALTDGNVAQYPFDTYRAGLVLAVLDASGSDPTTLPVAIGASTAVSDFTIQATPPPSTGDIPANIAALELDVSRRTNAIVYAVAMMLLMWGLAITGVLIAWTVVIGRVDVPLWAYGYFVGVLFALPPLRDSLPGRPPPGVLIDYVAFYWSVGIVGVSLLLLVFVWIRRIQRAADQPAPPPP